MKLFDATVTPPRFKNSEHEIETHENTKTEGEDLHPDNKRKSRKGAAAAIADVADDEHHDPNSEPEEDATLTNHKDHNEQTKSVNETQAGLQCEAQR